MRPVRNSQRAVADRPPTILLAEDDLEMRKLLSWSLEREGYTTIECADGLMLMRKLGLLGPGDRVQSHDLIISDIRMPGLTGLEVLECAREFPDFPPIVLITAFPDAESRDQATRLGAVATFVKPFEIKELLDKVRQLIPSGSPPRQPPSDAVETAVRAPFPLDITFRHDSGSEAAKDYIRSVATKLRRFANHVVSGKIVIDQSDRAEHRDHRYNIALVLLTPGRPIVIKYNTNRGATDDNFYMAINVAFGMAIRKLRQHVEKRQMHRRYGTKKDRTLQLLDD